MKRIGIISDTHGHYELKLETFFKDCDEVWHAGDVGKEEVLSEYANFPLLRAVHGNIDDWKVRASCPVVQRFQCEDVRVLMTHIGGYPGRYQPELRILMKESSADLVICGHSHILKVMFDKQNDCLFINPGAIGKHGLHKVRTAVRLIIEGDKMRDLEILELER